MYERTQPAAFTFGASIMNETSKIMEITNAKISVDLKKSMKIWDWHTINELPKLQIYFCHRIYPTTVWQCTISHYLWKRPMRHTKECWTRFRYMDASHIFFFFSSQYKSLPWHEHFIKTSKSHWWWMLPGLLIRTRWRCVCNIQEGTGWLGTPVWRSGRSLAWQEVGTTAGPAGLGQPLAGSSGPVTS